ncbi:carbohydrate-selective porin OprB [Nostoc commune NIES-4072]|uniref:Carbohydrate-selective porin OprB n=1 Tax=Nostoc commune NIES-4072 TaxID=2005467 RepID=A0A2R5FEM2_NOSCO|nr:iron uptake porin [Nostoc commune]BBD65789.1 carbohydrate-selective porin OprB [Nostoc commune HK-02]GBG16886.1 carbohydrate-selective porin OprB [Nostoc commune NIES-4072]
MSNLLWKTLVLSPVVLGVTVLVSARAMATKVPASSEGIKAKVAQAEAPIASSASIFIQTEPLKVNRQLVAQKTDENKVLEEVNRYSSEGKKQNSLSQVTSVSQFSDVQPTDWAFQALQSLVERYGCIAGYPNSTYRGNRALTRYEFAAGLNACLDRVNELIATATADLVTKQDLATLQRLQEEFSAELATLRGRVDAVEARTAELEANQFSTTTKLVGEAIFAVTDIFGGNTGDANNTVFQDRVRLDLQTSFTGKDVLHTRLAAGNAQAFSRRDNVNGDLNTSEGTQTFQLNGGSTNNNVNIDWLAYYVPIGPAQVYLAATGGIHSDYVATNNPYFEDYDGGNGALSTFASESPIYRIGGGAGAALTLPFGSGGSFFKPSSLTVGYLASNANNPGANQGLLEGNYAALGQLNFSVGDRLAFAATYVHGYHGAGSIGLFDAGGGLTTGANPVVGTNQANTLQNASSSNSYGVSAAFRPSDKLSISGFVSYHDVTGFGANDDYEAWSYGVGIALPDFGKPGNVLGIFAGAEPYSFNRTGLAPNLAGNDIPYHFEGFYKYRVSDNISITPGVIWLTSPGQNSGNDDAIIGTLRTTFTF